MIEVSLVKCESYDEKEVRTALEAVLEPVGGLEWVRSGMTVVIKANLVAGMSPDKAVTTHPVLLCELTKMLKAKGATVVIGDSPGGIYSHAYVNRVYAAAGLKAAEECGAELNQDFLQRDMENPDGKVLKNLTYTAYLDRADAIIDFCKLKSHGMMGMSAAAKNMFGAIPGTIKPEYHFKYPKYEDFADMIVDIDELFKPRLSIVDAITGMEGNGPTAGEPRYMGFLGASCSPHKLDRVCAEILGLTSDSIPTLTAAINRGLTSEKVEDIAVNADIKDFLVPDFKHNATRSGLQFSGRGNNPVMKVASKLMGKILRSVPKVHKIECVACGVCAGICPAKAITIENKKVSIDREKCICCFCCQEFCPKGAMVVHRPIGAKIAGKL
ncbi:MAG: DUF362 domain-containing protein [Oscillospiraceae bacterium]|nr:DUF362 domain-containing protein [Oscillospiraceae bacterium]